MHGSVVSIGRFGTGIGVGLKGRGLGRYQAAWLKVPERCRLAFGVASWQFCSELARKTGGVQERAYLSVHAVCMCNLHHSPFGFFQWSIPCTSLIEARRLELLMGSIVALVY